MLKKILIMFSGIISNCFAYNEFISKYVFTWVDQAPEIVEKYLLSSIDNSDSAYILGRLYLGDFKSFPKDLKKADYFLTLSANKNNPAAINSIGDGYYSGDIRKKDFSKALEYYERAAKLGFGPAQFNAGIILLNNGKTEKDLKKAIFWLDKASKNSHDLGNIIVYAKKYKVDAQNKLNGIIKSKEKI